MGFLNFPKSALDLQSEKNCSEFQKSRALWICRAKKALWIPKIQRALDLQSGKKRSGFFCRKRSGFVCAKNQYMYSVKFELN